MITCKEIVKKYLEENDYDGLYQPFDCACPVNDLMPCGDGWYDCLAGVITNKRTEYDFCIGPKDNNATH